MHQKWSDFVRHCIKSVRGFTEDQNNQGPTKGVKILASLRSYVVHGTLSLFFIYFQHNNTCNNCNQTMGDDVQMAEGAGTHDILPVYQPNTKSAFNAYKVRSWGGQGLDWIERA